MRTFWDKVKDKFWLKVNWYSCGLAGRPEIAREETDVHFRKMRQEDLEELLRMFPKEISERKYNILKDRLSEDGREAFVAVTSQGDTPAGYFCTAVADTYVGGVKEILSVPAGTVYLFDDYVFERYRGRRLHGLSIRFRMERYQQRGCTRALVCIYATNDTSINSYQQSGFQYVGSETRIVPLGRTIHSKELNNGLVHVC